MKYLNKENITALVIVVVGVLVASLVAPTIQGLVGKFTKKSTPA
jgi:hypothetical protein